MNIRLILSAAALTAATLTNAAYAQTTAPAPTAPVHNTDERQATQHNRIKEGRQSGELTKKESVRLHAEQRAIKRQERIANADGKVTANEQKRIRGMQNLANKDIAHQKSDQKQRPAAQ